MRSLAVLRFERLGLRTRITLAFAFGGLLVSVIIALATLGLTRQNLLTKRDETVFAVFSGNGQRVRNELTSATDDEGQRAIIERLGQTAGTLPLLFFRGQWTAADPLEFHSESVPPSLLALLETGVPGRIRTSLDGRPATISGVPITGTEVEATYFEAAFLDDIQDTLDALAVILFGVSAGTTLIAAAVGARAARSLLKPLVEVRTAAEALAAGELDTRLEPPADADLASLTATFNDMAGALEDRIERDARFASEVSHELRSPLMTLTASVEVLNNSSGDLSSRGRKALELLSADIIRFNQLVEDLVEISRYDVGTAALQGEPIDIVEFVQQAVSHQAHENVEVEPAPGAEGTIIEGDKRRLAQVVANLVDNATKYGASEVLVAVERRSDRVIMSVEDDGPGVPVAERDVIFDRFSRGRTGGRREQDSGSGLGLALVAEHVGLHGGRVWVEDRRDATPGARFVVDLPVGESEQ